MRRRSRYGWLELIEGILLILLGIYTLFNPGNTIRGITVVYGILAVITGSQISYFMQRLSIMLVLHLQLPWYPVF